jgi:hypothetical protein
MDDLYVDCHDFLCPVFQGWERIYVTYERSASLLQRCFGQKILSYFQRAANTLEQKRRIALCNLAAFDDQIAYDHFNNKAVIQGRYNVLFRSAFFVRLPIRGARVTNVTPLDADSYTRPNPDVTLWSS